MDTVQPEQSPIITYEQTTPPQVPPPQGSSFRISKKLLLIIGAVILVVVVSSVLFLRSKSSQNQPTAEAPNVLLAEVGDQKIYRNDVVKAAGEQYLPSAITNVVLKNYLDVLIERKIIELEAEKLNITATDNEVQERVTRLQPTQTQPSSSLYTSTKYVVLKDKIMAKNVKNIQAYSIGFWITSYDYPQKPEYDVQRKEGDKALTEIESMLKKGQAPLEVTEYIYAKYPVLQSILALNGYVYNSVSDKSVFMKPNTYVLQEKEDGKTNYDPDNFAILSTIKPNEIKRVTRRDGSGGTIIQCISATPNGFSSYKEFLAERKKELVKMHNTL